MKRFLSLTLCLAMVAAASVAFAANGTATGDSGERLHKAVPGYEAILWSDTQSALAARETAGPDTFALFGGPDEPIEGKFNLANEVSPDWGGGTGGTYTGVNDDVQWRPVDTTQQLPYWHVDTFNAENLNNNGVGNNAMWSGLDATDSRTETWQDPPGYGNSWNDALVYTSAPVADPSVGQTVDLDFYFNLELELNFDFFLVEYDSAGTWTPVMNLTGSNLDTNNVFQAPGLLFSDFQSADIVYSGNDYGGDAGDQIRVRLFVSTDAGWSDEDGSNPTIAGAVQADDISLSSTVDIAPVTEDFEGAAPYLFNPEQSPFVGDFAEVWGQMSDLDPCIDNNTPVMLMIDSGQIIRNGPGIGGETSIIGGSTSTGVTYGVPGNYVVNYTGGLSFGQLMLRNEVWSPEVAWDFPGAGDDGVDVAGAKLRFSVWMHLPTPNGIFFIWHMRSKYDGSPYTGWQNRNTVWYGDFRSWQNYNFLISDLLLPSPDVIQVAMATWDYSIPFGLPGDGATPSPAFDNIALYKYRIQGPTFTRDEWDAANDGFPVSGSIDVSTEAARDGLDIPFDMADDVDGGETFLDPGDSITVDVTSNIPGATLDDLRMFWALNTNPLFESTIRSAPARAKDVSVVAGLPGTIWSGQVIADTCKASNGAIIDDRFFFDLPDVDFIYPGDVLQYYIQGTDSDGRITTFPGNLQGFGDFTPNGLYNRNFIVRGLPTISDDTGTQPNILVWNDFGRRGSENEFLGAFEQLGYTEGVHFDTYTTEAPSSGVSNGLGSAGGHGANADQLAGYNHIFYFGGTLSSYLLSDGSGTGVHDKSDDFGLLQLWGALPGSRNVAYWGDDIAYSMAQPDAGGIALGYLNTTMGVQYGDRDVKDVIGGQTAPVVVPHTGSFASIFNTPYVAYGGCFTINRFDQIETEGSAEAGHVFTTAGGVAIPPTGDAASSGVGSVVNVTADGTHITFPYSVRWIQNTQRAVGLSARTQLFAEILQLFSAPGGGPAVDAGPDRAPAKLSVYPNPFNPQTTVKFSNVSGLKGSVKVFNLRGELVRTLHSGEFTVDTFTWDGSDNRGASVASGVYVIQAQAGGNVLTKKAALVK